MYLLGNILFVLVSGFLCLLVLLRPSEGGSGLGAFAGGSGADSPFGVRAVQTLDKVIAWTAGILLLLALLMAYANGRS
jgi:protein translocase SecG subunit